jgi:Leucine-rich repeat (LRR) protein
MPQLTELYLAENPLVSVGQLHTMPNLKKLHLRGCEIEKFDAFPDLQGLEYLNLRETKIASLEDVKKLEILQNLIYLNMLGTPVADDLADGIKKEFILLFPDLYLEKVNKEALTPEDFQEAEELKQERIREEEEKKRQAEAEGEGEAKEE